MKRRILFFTLGTLLTLAFACDSNDAREKEELARNYYKALTDSDYAQIVALHYDSIRVKEGPFISAYSKESYSNWFQWDSVFNPNYEILDFKIVDEGAEITVSKVCERIEFLNGGPMVSKEILRFKDHKIYEQEIAEFVSFDNENWDAQRTKLVEWIDQNHPELNGFINDQSLQGGLNYLKALQLFQERNP